MFEKFEIKCFCYLWRGKGNGDKGDGDWSSVYSPENRVWYIFLQKGRGGQNRGEKLLRESNLY